MIVPHASSVAPPSGVTGRSATCHRSRTCRSPSVRDTRRDLEPHTPRRAPRSRGQRGYQNRTLEAVQAGQSLVYAVRFPDGIIKIGCSGNLAKRMDAYRSKGGELVGFMPGDYALEQEIHGTLRDHLARGREWYHSVPAVIAIVNEMRDGFKMPHLAA